MKTIDISPTKPIVIGLTNQLRLSYITMGHHLVCVCVCVVVFLWCRGAPRNTYDPSAVSATGRKTRWETHCHVSTMRSCPLLIKQLVGGVNPSEKYEFVTWGCYSIPNIWAKCSHQPEIVKTSPDFIINDWCIPSKIGFIYNIYIYTLHHFLLAFC